MGDPNAVFIFKAGSTLITASNSSVIVLNGGTACNVFWQVGSSATLGTGSSLIGTVLAQTSISATTGATIQGRLLARTGAVTLDTNTITRPICAAGPTTSSTTSTSTTRPGATAPGGTPSTPSGPGGAPTAPGGTPVGSPSGGLPAGTGSSAGGQTGGIPQSDASSSGGSATPGEGTGRTTRTGAPELPTTGGDLGLVLAAMCAVALGWTLVASSKARLGSTPPRRS